MISVKNGVDPANTLISKTIKDIYWDNVEEKDEKSVKEYLLSKKCNIYKELDDREIKPIIEYPEYHKYPQREKNVNTEYTFQEYQTVSSVEEHAKLIESLPGFISKDGFKSSLYTHMKDANGHEFSEKAVESKRNISLSKFNTSRSFDISKNSDVEGNLSLAQFLESSKLLILDVAKNNRGAFLSDMWAELDIFGNRLSYGDDWANFLEIGIVLPLAIFDIPTIIAYEIKGKQFALVEVLDRLLNVVSTQYAEQGGLEEFYYLLEGLKKEKPFKDRDSLSQALTAGQVATKSYIDGAPRSVKDVFVSAYDWWLVWYVPILIIPTGLWITKIAGSVKPDSYTYIMGVPFSFNLDNIVPPERKNIEGIDAPEPKRELNPELEIVPDKLKAYPYKWLPVNDWLTYNKLYDYDINTNHQTYKNLSQDDVNNIYSSFVDTVYELYEGNTPVYIDKKVPYAKATNYITNYVTNSMVRPPSVKTNISISSVVDNLILNPTMEDKDMQNKFNINELRLIVNTNYNITLKAY